MSTYISPGGEYDEHELTDAEDPFVCQRCFMFDEMAATSEIVRLQNDLRRAERVCALYGWTAIRRDESDREKALYEVWSEWLAARPGMAHPDAWPDLTDERIAALAERRDLVRAATLARIVGDDDD